MSIVEQALINGILQAGIYAMMAIGLNLIYGVLKIINFAHGEFLMISMYIAYWVITLYSFNIYTSSLIVLPIMMLIGYLLAKFLIEPILKDPEINQLLITLALSIILQNIALLLWTSDFKSLRVEASSYNIFGIILPSHRLISFIEAVVITILTYYMLMKTQIGIKIRAVAQSPEITELLGINSKQIRILVFILGTVLAGFAGIAIIPIYYVYPTVGQNFALIMWVIIVLGGLGSVTGALLASFIIGIIESLVATFYTVELARAVIFTLFIIILAIRPTGLLGEKARV